MTNRIEETINSIKARIENEVKKDSPDWDAIIQLANNGRIAQGQLPHFMWEVIDEAEMEKAFESNKSHWQKKIDNL